jgi:hypothetical protein
VNIRVGFSHETERAAFRDLFEEVLAGTHGARRPIIRVTEPEPGEEDPIALDMRLSYPDICTLGRFATVAFTQEFGDQVGPYLHLLRNTNIRSIQDSGVLNALPAETKATIEQRLTEHTRVFGRVLDKDETAASLLGTGRFGIIGAIMRRELARREVPLEPQRPQDERPAIEKGLHFRFKRTTKQGIPVSQTSMGNELRGDLRKTKDDLLGFIKERDVFKGLQDVWDLATGLGGPQGVGLVLRGLFTLGRGSVLAGWRTLHNRQVQRQIKQRALTAAPSVENPNTDQTS